MNLEIGKAYVVNNKYKKSVIEKGEYVNTEKNETIYRTIVWRSGTFIVTPQSDDEIKKLQACLNEEATFVPSEFDEWEFDSTWDGCDEYWESDDTDMDEIYSRWEDIEDSEEGSDYFGMEEYIEEDLEYGLEDTEFTIEGGIVIEDENN